MGCGNSEVEVIHISLAPKSNPPKIIPTQQQHKSFQSQNKGDNFFKEGNYIQAIKAYKQLIENGYTINYDIQGLGNTDHSYGRYEWFAYRWYQSSQNDGKFKGNAFDALSLCFNAIRNTNQAECQRGILWYEDMIKKRNGYEIQMGYANLLYNLSRFEEAIQIYNKIIQEKPNLINAYVCLAMTYQYRRIEKSKATSIAKTILTKDAQNMYAHFLLAKNQQNIENKISQLKQLFNEYPQYVRIGNQIGISYGSIKQDYKQAISWYKKCIEMVPEYTSCYNNIGVNYQLLNQQKQAMKWYFQTCQRDPQYRVAYFNLTDIFDSLKYKEKTIEQQIKNYPHLNLFTFYYYVGVAYYDKNKYQRSLFWYNKALTVDAQNYQLMNALGILYDETKEYQNSRKYYVKCIQKNNECFGAYYNMAILYQNMKNVQKSIELYEKTLQLNPHCSYAYNNLGDIYETKKEYTHSADLYKKGVDNLSTYTLGFANLAICLIRLQKYQQAFAYFERASQLLPTDNNDLSQGNKRFLKQNLQLFGNQGQKWKKTGKISTQQKQFLQKLVKSFQSNFNKIYSGQTTIIVDDEKALKPEILEIVNTIYKDKFRLKNIEVLFSMVKDIFDQDEEYFHIIPQLFIQYFWNHTFKYNQPILEIEDKLSSIVKRLSQKESNTTAGPSSNYSLDVKMKYFNPPNEYKANLFKNKAFFDNYQALYSEIYKVSEQAERSFSQFDELIQSVKTRSNGTTTGVSLKFPKRQDRQFKVILRILQKMFKNEINQTKVKLIIQKIDRQLKFYKGSITLMNVVHQIVDVWTKEITIILQQRSKNKIETICSISDLIRAKIMFNSVQDLSLAIQTCDKLCHQKNYPIVQLDNRLSKKQTIDVVLKIQIKDALCQLQLAMKQDQTKYHFIHSIYEIQRSPLGCIFGSYLFMSKGSSYPILANCKDIQSRLKQSPKEQDKKTVLAAQYIIKSLQTPSPPP